jgi:two-component system response regulator FixJ
MANERKIHIVDDDVGVRRSLELLLESAGWEAVSYATPFEFIGAIPDIFGGCLLLDVRMPGMDGLELQEFLAKLGADLPVVVMTAQGDIATAVRAMKAGAVDFIEKPFSDERLMQAIEAAFMQGRKGEWDSEKKAAARKIGALSRREREVLDGLVAGRPNKIIADELGISVRTVEVHRARMLERLGVRGLGAAVRLLVISTLLA